MHLKIENGELNVDLHHTVSEMPDAAEFGQHCHGMVELIYVVSGKGVYIVEGAEYRLLPNTVLLLRPYEYHYVCPEKDCPYERYVIHFDVSAPFDAAKTLEGFLGNGGEIGAGVYFSEQTVDSSIRHAFEALDSLQEFLSTGNGLNSGGRVLLRSIITQILLLLGVARSEERVLPEKNILADVIGYINEHLEENLSLDELSRRFFVSKYHLCRAFRQCMGTTFLSYLTTKRVAVAQRLIEQGEAATEVAYRVGFRDYSSFYRAYRKQTGRAPAWERK